MRPQRADFALHPPVLSCTNDILSPQLVDGVQELENVGFPIGDRDDAGFGGHHGEGVLECGQPFGALFFRNPSMAPLRSAGLGLGTRLIKSLFLDLWRALAMTHTPI